MKPIHAVAVMLLCAGLIACGKKESPLPATEPAAPKAAEVPKTEAPAAPAPAPTVTPAAVDTSVPAQSLIDKVKDLVSKKDYPGALNTLKELSAIQLTAEQQKIVDDLKAQVQKAMAGAAASDVGKSAGGLLGQ